MIEYLDSEKINELKEVVSSEDSDGKSKITIYLPLKPLDSLANQLELKNILNDVEIEGLSASKNAIPKINLNVPLNHLAKGLLIVSSEKVLRCFLLPFEVPRFIYKDNKYFLAPILLNRHRFNQFYFLALSQKCPRLFQVDLLNISEIEMPSDLLGPLLEKMNIDELPRSLQYHSTDKFSDNNGRSQHTATYHGHSDRANKTQTEMLGKFLRNLEDDITKTTSHEYPIILGGVEKLLATMKRSIKKLKIAEGALIGNFEDDDIASIHSKLIPIIERELNVLGDPINIEHYLPSHGSEDDLECIFQETLSGNVDQLFIDADYLYRKMSSNSNSCGLLEGVIRGTLQHGGRVKIIPEGLEIPMHADLRHYDSYQRSSYVQLT